MVVYYGNDSAAGCDGGSLKHIMDDMAIRTPPLDHVVMDKGVRFQIRTGVKVKSNTDRRLHMHAPYTGAVADMKIGYEALVSVSSPWVYGYMCQVGKRLKRECLSHVTHPLNGQTSKLGKALPNIVR